MPNGLTYFGKRFPIASARESSDAERLYLKSSILESSHLARLDPEQAPRVAPGPGFGQERIPRLNRQSAFKCSNCRKSPLKPILSATETSRSDNAQCACRTFLSYRKQTGIPRSLGSRSF